GRLPRPPHTDLITLPTIAKDASGRYQPRRQRCSLAELINQRSALIKHTLQAFGPQLLVVDKVADGLMGELLPALESIRRDDRVRAVLGLREVLDDPVTVRRDWQAAATAQVIADHYDEVWVYGDPAVYDPVLEYGWGTAIAGKINYTGYLGTSRRRRTAPAGAAVRPMSVGADHGSQRRSAGPPADPYVLCQLGGGQDGYAVAAAFARSTLPATHRGVIVTGPYLSDAERRSLRQLAGPQLTLINFAETMEEFVAGADAVVSMAGYNSTVEVLSTSTPALLVPRTRPRLEQLIRAERLADHGCVDLLRPEELGPDRISGWLDAAVSQPRQVIRRSRQQLDLSGRDRIGHLAGRLLTGVEHAA
ncbi:MAG TPA: glycosyltransferase, partial [Microlunatus sp.]